MKDQLLREKNYLQENLEKATGLKDVLTAILNSRPYLVFELLVIFAGAPLAFFYGLIPLPEVVTLVIISVVLSIWLFGFARVESFRFSLRIKWETLRQILVRFAFAATVLTGIILVLEPEYFLYLILDEPQIWLLIILLYPFLSVLPQELIYRVFFFRRYRTLITNSYLMIHINALAFGFLHIIYGNYTAVFLAYAAGYIFARTYQKTRSFWAVSFEHLIYGILIFTIGMGQFFVNGS